MYDVENPETLQKMIEALFQRVDGLETDVKELEEIILKADLKK